MCCRPCGPLRYYRPPMKKYVEIQEIKKVDLKEARKHYTNDDVIEAAKEILAEKTDWEWTETRDRHVLEQLYLKDKFLARIGLTDKVRSAIDSLCYAKYNE